MSESATAVKLLAVLATVILLANLMGVGATSPFQALQDSLGQGPDLPEFQDPFTLREFIAITMLPIGSSSSFLAPDGVVGCAPADYWECLDSRDGNTSYVTLDGSRFLGMSMRTIQIPEFAPDIILSRVEVEVQYRSASVIDNMTFGIVASILGQGVMFSPLLALSLPIAADWTSAVRSGPPVSRLPMETIRDRALDPAQFIIAADDWEDIDISYVRMSLYAAGDPDCSAPPGAWFPIVDELACQVAQGVDWLITALQFVVNAVAFGIQYIGGWLVWSGLIIAAFLGGVIDMALWFLNIDAPPAVQGFFAIITVMSILFFFIVVLRLVRG